MHKNVNTDSDGFSLSLASVYCACTLLGRRVCKRVDVYIITWSCTWQIYALSERLLVVFLFPFELSFSYFDLLARDAMLARYMLSSYVCSSVCLSDTSQYSTVGLSIPLPLWSSIIMVRFLALRSVNEYYYLAHFRAHRLKSTINPKPPKIHHPHPTKYTLTNLSFLADRTIGWAFGTVSRLSSVCPSVCNDLYCGKTVRTSQKVSEGVNRNQGQKVHFFGRRHISTSGFDATATDGAVFWPTVLSVELLVQYLVCLSSVVCL